MGRLYSKPKEIKPIKIELPYLSEAFLNETNNIV